MLIEETAGQNDLNTLVADMKWLNNVIMQRVNNDVFEAPDIPVVDPEDTSLYAEIIRAQQFSVSNRLVFALALAPHFAPYMLDVLMENNPITGRPFNFAGGRYNNACNTYLPTAETALHLLAGDDMAERLVHMPVFDSTYPLIANGLIRINEIELGEPFLSGILSASEEIIEQIAFGKVRVPRFSTAFPAEMLTSKMDWEDLVLSHSTAQQIEEIETWIMHSQTIMQDWGLGKKIKPGYRALFHGPPGTGKSVTAALLGKRTGKDVYRIDLSKVVSKYIGETEKNLSNIFDKAENKSWILFFDEADALFGKRTNISNSNDRYANQEVSYLLQRIESFNGLVILASNLKTNMDEAFMRRFQADIYFPMPMPAERQQLWEKSFSAVSVFEDRINLEKIAHDYEIAGGSILNVVQYSSLMAIKRNSKEIQLNDLIDGIRKEFHKEGKVL